MAAPDSKPSGSAPSWLFSAIGVIVVFALMLTINFIVRKAMPAKIDLTEDKLHTLSDGTKEILGGLDTPVTISFFVSKDKENMPPELTTFAKRVNALLDEYSRNASGDLLEIERVNPEPDSEAEDRAKLNNLRAIPGRLNEPAYIGLTATCLDRKSSIPLILPNRDQMLEYDISRAIVEVTRESPPKIGLISALPVTGGAPAMPFGPQQPQQQQPWQFYSSLQRDYNPGASGATPGEGNIVNLGVTVEEIPDDIDVVLLVHPAGITEAGEFALDQFLMRGGRIVAFLDAFSAIAAESQPRQQPQFGGQQPPGIPTSSDLKTLLPAWGVTFEANQVLADRTFETAQSETRVNPTVLSISAEGINGDDALTSSMRELLLYMAGVFYVDDKEGIEVTTLVHSSDQSQLVVPQTAQFNPDQITQEFEASGKEYPLAIRLVGKFKTAFPDGKPGAEAPAAPDEDSEDKDAAKDKPTWLKESQKEGSIMLVGDSDMLFDSLAITRSMFGVQYRNHNVPLLQGAVEQAAGGANLIAVRSRGSTTRPFNKFKELRAEASKELMKEITKVDEKQRVLSGELSKLMQEQGNNQMVVVSPEVMEKINDLKAQEVEAAKRKRELNRELRKDIRKIENSIKNWNIIGIPLLIVAIGVVHLLVRKSKMSAR
jgi:ABC-type uncharacterized transport system involved in gliding motility auxiliary subunit